MLAQVAAAVLAAVALLYAVAMLEVLGVARASILVLAAVLSLAYLLYSNARTRRRDSDANPGALHDPLTGLPTRPLFVERVEETLERSADGLTPATILFVDLDDFKEVNQGLGYEAGDRLLCGVAERLRSAAGGITDVSEVARLGGDEFIILLGGLSDQSSALDAAEKIRRLIEIPFLLGESEVFVCASIGVATSGAPGLSTPESLLREANVALQEAKKKGKARCRVFDPGAESSTGGRLILESEVRRAVREGEFRVYYQPLVSLTTGRIGGMEALVRWQHPLYGLLPPAEFIPLAEQTGLITHIGRHVLEEACSQVRRWQDEHGGEPALTLNVNVSAVQFRQPNLVQEVFRTLKRSGLAAGDLKLEITESIMMHDASSVTALRELKAKGIKIAMDDFGTGYSSLSYLKRFPVDTLKIDRSYVEGLGSDAGDTAIVHATVAFAKSLNLDITAEGIERIDQLIRLRDLGCEFGQGYHFAKPLPVKEAAQLLASNLAGR
ncbi:MAG: diguanylate cyclase/phosphodiesterase (GGDEF & EAL domains) with PAS/PAC sensor(s) [uncultured Rubrobacteraceae bacterium]|uniref:Diguanylate cyclase/phosphodiesterase (GGDEF & EAL domains) with PAS/PAC sensor(S) n=1 Tax=uncultured Rubrobacteraceae bacterium TaxID=349277 RepID=A0A6J4R860_9ACTN|nr:MAG: diguanylate cyclase/phosphodiesterase (GGDEF & EAL domains) with PAS/PAC sensor(s) [uncultured Rubrobacteraceae bacterium]